MKGFLEQLTGFLQKKTNIKKVGIMNTYKEIENCRFCGCPEWKEVFVQKNLPISGIYNSNNEHIQVTSPITVIECKKCNLVQLKETLNPQIYEQYHFVGNSAGGYEEYLKKLSNELIESFDVQNKSIFEIGASNGVFLKFLREEGNNEVQGIEPSKKLCQDAKKFNIDLEEDFFNKDYVKQHQDKFDVVIIRHVLEHINDLSEVIKSISEIIKQDGKIVVEVPDLNKMIEKKLFSNIFHEHLNYFSLKTLNNLFKEINFYPIYTTEVAIHGGAILAIYEKRANSKIDLDKQVNIKKIENFFEESETYYQKIKNKIFYLMSEEKIIHGFGASHRTFSLMGNSCLNKKHIPYIYDNNVLLHNKYLNGSQSKIVSPSLIKQYQPDVIVIFATSYEKEISFELRNTYNFEGQILLVSE